MKTLIEIAPFIVLGIFVILIFFVVYNSIKNTKKKTKYFSNTLRKELEEEKKL